MFGFRSDPKKSAKALDKQRKASAKALDKQRKASTKAYIKHLANIERARKKQLI